LFLGLCDEVCVVTEPVEARIDHWVPVNDAFNLPRPQPDGLTSEGHKAMRRRREVVHATLRIVRRVGARASLRRARQRQNPSSEDEQQTGQVANGAQIRNGSSQGGRQSSGALGASPRNRTAQARGGRIGDDCVAVGCAARRHLQVAQWPVIEDRRAAIGRLDELNRPRLASALRRPPAPLSWRPRLVPAAPGPV